MLTCSVSEATPLRLANVRLNFDGDPTFDPRLAWTPQFQLLPVDDLPTEFGAWTDGEWEDNAPPTGPYGATIVLGAAQPAPVNPGEVGVYWVYVRWNPTSGGASPAFSVGTVQFTAP